MDKKLLTRLNDLKQNKPHEYLKMMGYYKDNQPELYSEIVEAMGEAEEKPGKKPDHADSVPESVPNIDRQPFTLDTSEITKEEAKKQELKKSEGTNWTLIVLVAALVIFIIIFIGLIVFL